MGTRGNGCVMRLAIVKSVLRKVVWLSRRKFESSLALDREIAKEFIADVALAEGLDGREFVRMNCGEGGVGDWLDRLVVCRAALSASETDYFLDAGYLQNKGCWQSWECFGTEIKVDVDDARDSRSCYAAVDQVGGGSKLSEGTGECENDDGEDPCDPRHEDNGPAPESVSGW